MPTENNNSSLAVEAAGHNKDLLLRFLESKNVVKLHFGTILGMMATEATKETIQRMINKGRAEKNTTP